MSLSTTSIKETIEKLKKLEQNLDKANEEIVDQLSDLGLNEIQNNYGNTLYRDGNNDVAYFQKGSRNKKVIGVTGSQVLYNEFGTGTEGSNNSHPEKGKYGLNAYNSGSKIRENKSDESTASQKGIAKGGLYWIYNNDGELVYTQGIPAGKQVYEAKKTLEKQKKEISKKVVGDAISKL